MFDYMEAEWGDYIRLHASHVESATGLEYRVAEEIVREAITRGEAPEDLWVQIAHTYNGYMRG